MPIPDSQDSALAELRDVHRTFTKDGETIRVLQGVSLTIARGESVSIMGRSGAGKTTFMQVLGTLDRPTSGTLVFDGVDVFALPERKLARFRGSAIGFVFQFHHLLPEFTTLENAAMPAVIARMPRAEAHQRATELLQRVGLGDRLGHRPGELSGGEQQRVALARALVMRPKLLLADEPTGNLDVQTGTRIVELLDEVRQEFGISVVVVTHDPKLGARMQRQLIMEDGVLRAAGDSARRDA